MNYFKKRRSAFGYAFKGLFTFFKEEAHPKVHAISAAAAILMGWFLSISKMEWIAVILCIGMVLFAEAINSALERLTDIASPDYLDAAGRVKDIAAGAVLIASFAAAVVGLIIFLPKILELL